MDNFLPDHTIDQIITSQLHEKDVEFDSRRQANNHLDLGYQETESQLRAPILNAFSKLLFSKNIEVDFIIPMPGSAVGWIEAFNKLRVYSPEIISLRKVTRRKFELIDDIDESKYANKQGIVFDDTTIDGGSGEAAADYLTDSKFAITAIVSLFVRGEQLAKSSYPRFCIAHRLIPSNLDWKKFRQQGKIEQLRS
ncbi:hypothetical protein EB118_06270 [bacterium]|nr:hypothetical protein [bacterium]NBX98425.1 hypothetical protein [bacterium]NDC94356.1 hypothetical protein [bacterium]NDD83828.1 hypothetical protein [bacterium]NDG29683.1 hypothetical protein [bacterium]